MKTHPKADYISWDQCFMEIAHVIAKRSKDPSTQVGAVVVDKNNIVVGLGYNGFPKGDGDYPWEKEGNYLETKYPYVCHAEENAIYNSSMKVKDCILYSTLFPCNECAKTIIQTGIKEIVYENDKYHDEDSYKASRIMLNNAGITYRAYIYAKQLST